MQPHIAQFLYNSEPVWAQSLFFTSKRLSVKCIFTNFLSSACHDGVQAESVHMVIDVARVFSGYERNWVAHIVCSIPIYGDATDIFLSHNWCWFATIFQYIFLAGSTELRNHTAKCMCNFTIINLFIHKSTLSVKSFSRNIINENSTFVQVRPWCYQATSHYYRQCWPSSHSLFISTSKSFTTEFSQQLLVLPSHIDQHNLSVKTKFVN